LFWEAFIFQKTASQFNFYTKFINQNIYQRVFGISEDGQSGKFITDEHGYLTIEPNKTGF